MWNDNIKYWLAMTATGLVSLSMLLAGACNTGNNTPTSTSTNPSSLTSYLNAIQPIFNNNCVVCHQLTGQANLALEPGKSYGNLIGVQSTQAPEMMRVKAGAPDQSYLLAKLNGTQVQAGGGGGRMPQGLPPLSQAQIDLITKWIAEGALNN